MKILIAANSFYPAVGGYERVALLIARQLVLRGHSVKVITLTRSRDENPFPFEVYRQPSARVLMKLLRWSDVYIQNNVSFKLLWPLFFRWRPLVCVHHGFYVGTGNSAISWRSRLKHLVTLFSTNISVSHAIAKTLPGKSYVALNPYEDDVFFRIPNINKTRDLFFVGRIVSDKGIDVLIEALAQLRSKGIAASLTVAGAGPEEYIIRQKVYEFGLQDLVVFTGRVTDEELNALLNAHKIMVVPTREGEGFGVVALEGIACGCVVVGSTCGGLPEAIGACGVTFPNGDAAALAQLLYELLTRQEDWSKFFNHAKAHLDAHKPTVVVDRYLDVLTKAVGRQ
jgi:glycogen(starch) synthase